MRTFLFASLVSLSLAACGGSSKPEPAPANQGAGVASAAAAGSSAPAADHKPGATSFPNECCCVTGSDSSMAFDGAAECQKDGGSCTDTWTESCKGEAAMQEAADQRNAADAQCPSGDHHDCDGDGYRYGDDKDDNDPKMH